MTMRKKTEIRKKAKSQWREHASPESRYYRYYSTETIPHALTEILLSSFETQPNSGCFEVASQIERESTTKM